MPRRRPVPAPAGPDFFRRLCIKSLFAIGSCATVLPPAWATDVGRNVMLFDDFSDKGLVSRLGTRWRGVSDRVMGGISEAEVVHAVFDGRPCLHLTGDVRLENNGGFIQAALDLSRSGDTLDASGYEGLRLVVRGNGERYGVHLRTPDNRRPWQSYRAAFTAGAHWQTIDIPFTAFEPYRLVKPLDTARLRRIGLVAIGRAFHADLAISELGLNR